MPTAPVVPYIRNLAFAKPLAKGQSYYTTLPPDQEAMFQSWVKQNNVPFDPGPTSDYDMRGFYQSLQSGNPAAATAVNPNDGRLHYPDTYKTPYHKSFSNESKFATPDAPAWNEKDQLVGRDGTVYYDERADNAQVR